MASKAKTSETYFLSTVKLQNAGLIFFPKHAKSIFLSHISAFILKFKLMIKNVEKNLHYSGNILCGKSLETIYSFISCPPINKL